MHEKKEIVTYDKEKIQIVLNLLNKLTVVGLEQVKLLAQASVILESPESILPCNDNLEDNKENELPEK